MTYTSAQDDANHNVQQDAYEKMLMLSQSAMLTLDTEFRFQQVTASIKSIIGYEAEQLIGKSYVDLIAIGYQEPFLTIIKNNETVQFDYPLINHQGDWCWVRHSGNYSKQGDVLQYNCFLQNVSNYKQPRDQIERERNLLRTIIDNLPAAIHATDGDGQYIFSNPAHAKLIGEDRPSDILGRNSRDVLPSELYERLIVKDQQILDTGQAISGEEHIVLNADSGSWFNRTKLPMRDTSGNIMGIIGIANDISQRKLSQQQLENNEARHRAVLDALPDMIFTLQKDGIITEFRPSPEVQSLGLNEFAVGKKINEMDLPQALVDEIQLYMSLELDIQYVQSFEFSKEKAVTARDDIADYYEARLVTLNDYEILALVRNITPLKRVQEELSRHIEDLTVVRQVNVELAANLNFNYVAQLALDAALRLSSAQAGYLMMLEEDDFSILSVFGEYDDTQLRQHLSEKRGIVARVLKKMTPELLLNVQEDADYLPLLEKTKAMMVIPLLSTDKPIGVLVLEARKPERFSHERFQFLQLITGRIASYLDNAKLYHQTQVQLEELKLLYDEVRHLEHLKTDMIRIASHDLKNPLSNIMGYLQVLRLDISDKLTASELNLLSKIEAAAEKMERLTTGLLSLERIQQFSEQQSLETVNLSELVRQSVVEQMDFAVSKQQSIQYDDVMPQVMIHADPLQIYEAILNLINNAIKYTALQGIITVTLNASDDIAKLRIKDSGYGIPKEDQDRLFSPFFRADIPEASQIEGTGLGLHLVQNIIRRHQGEIVFESTYGEGSTFGFDVPLNSQS